MATQKSTTNPQQFQSQSINSALNSRWKFYKTRSGIPVKTYASDCLDALPNAYLPISEAEYDRLERQS